MLLDIEAGEGAEPPLALGPDRDGVLHGLRKLLTQSLGEEDCQDPGHGGYNAHNEDRSREPELLEEVEQEAGDAAHPGHQGAGAHRLVPDHCGEHLGRVDIDNRETGAGSEFAHQGHKDLG